MKVWVAVKEDGDDTESIILGVYATCEAAQAACVVEATSDDNKPAHLTWLAGDEVVDWYADSDNGVDSYTVKEYEVEE